MAIDWKFLFEVKVEELNDVKAEELYIQLIEFNARDEENVQRLQQLFDVCKGVMQIKSLQAEVAVEELEDAVKKYDRHEIEILRKELEIFKQTEVKGSAKTLSETNAQIIDLKNTIESKESENIRMRRKLNDLQNSYDLRDKEVMSLRSEVEALRDEIDGQRQVDEQVFERQEPTDKLREKNRHIQTLLDELREAETMNLELSNQTKRLKIELKTATNELQMSCNQMEMFGKQLNESKRLNEDFISEKEFLSEEINKLKEALNRYESGDENIIDRFEENISQLHKLIQTKDEEIIKLKSLALIPDHNVKERQKNISKEFEEKDRQIDLLKSQLNEAVVDMESQTEIIQKMFEQNRGSEEMSKLNDRVLSLTDQLKNIEEEVLNKDDELLALRKRINTYERGEYGLRDALKEINDLTKHLNNRDQRIEEIVQQINELKIQLNDAEDVIEGIPDDDRVDGLQRRQRSKQEQQLTKKERIRALELEQQVLTLEDEKLGLTERLRLSLNKSVIDKQENKEIKGLRERLKSVETENLELQLGMKEILNGIRETDCESDVIIECPTLERVCRLLESRNINEDLTNIIALKAELDLVRGHNEQIRTDMRQLRNDYLKVISQYTQHLLETDFLDSDVDFKQMSTIPMKEKSREEVNEEEDKVSQKDVILFEEKIVETIEEKTGTNEMEETKNEYFIERQLILNNKETQTTEMSGREEVIETKTVVQSHKSIQTEDIFETTNETKIVDNISAKNLCNNCEKVMKIVDFLKNCVEKLEKSIKFSENKFTQRLQLLQTENKNLSESFAKKLSEKDMELMEREKHISSLQSKIMGRELVPSMATRDEFSSNEDRLVRADPNRFRSQPLLSSSCKTVLESVINCLQARLEHKDESIRQYRNMLSEAKQNFENEMIRLIDSNRESEEKNSINFTQLIDNEELESALKSCVNELEMSKTQLNARIRDLENELEAKNTKLMSYANENEELRHKKTSHISQNKQIVEQLREELKQKDSVINNLNKAIKDDRALRAQSVVKRPKEESMKRDRKVDNELFQEIANLRAVIDTQTHSIKTLEVAKWDSDKNFKELKEQMRNKLKDKEIEVLDLNEKLNKLKVRLNKNESEKHLLQNKVSKRENVLKNNSNKITQTSGANSEQELIKLKNELKKIKNELKERENEIKVLRNDLEVCRQTESELKTLLSESVRREKLATIQEEGIDGNEQYDSLLQENARIKVELRMAEFELKRREHAVAVQPAQGHTL